MKEKNWKDVGDLLLWLIPNEKAIEKNESIEEKVYGVVYQFGERDHRTFCKHFVEQFQLDHKGRGEGHLDYGRTFAENGFIFCMNSGKKLDGKYLCSLFLCEDMSPFQIQFIESQYPVLEQKFHLTPGLFGTLCYSSFDFGYNSGYDHFRSLKIEAQINRNPNQNNGLLLLKEEIDKRKELVEKREL